MDVSKLKETLSSYKGLRFNIRRREYDGKFNLWVRMTQHQAGMVHVEDPYAAIPVWVVAGVYDNRKAAFLVMDQLKPKR